MHAFPVTSFSFTTIGIIPFETKVSFDVVVFTTSAHHSHSTSHPFTTVVVLTFFLEDEIFSTIAFHTAATHHSHFTSHSFATAIVISILLNYDVSVTFSLFYNGILLAIFFSKKAFMLFCSSSSTSHSSRTVIRSAFCLLCVIYRNGR